MARSSDAAHGAAAAPERYPEEELLEIYKLEVREAVLCAFVWYMEATGRLHRCDQCANGGTM